MGDHESQNLPTFDNSCSREDEENKDLPSEDESGVLFYVNRDGLPIKKKTWERMWRHVEKIHPKRSQVTQSIRQCQHLDKVRWLVYKYNNNFIWVFRYLASKKYIYRINESMQRDLMHQSIFEPSTSLHPPSQAFGHFPRLGSRDNPLQGLSRQMGFGLYLGERRNLNLKC